MKITFVNNQYQLGGAETVIQQLAKGLTEYGFSYELYVALGKTYSTSKNVKPLYPKILSLLWHTSLHGAIERLFPRDAWTDKHFRHLASLEKEVVHIHNFHGNYATIDSLSFLAHKVPVVWTFHAFWGITGGCDHPRDCQRYLQSCGQCPQVGAWPIGPVDRTSEDLLKKKETIANAPIKIIAPAKHMQKKIQESPVGHHWDVRCIHNGIDVDYFKAQTKDKRMLKKAWNLDVTRTTLLVINRNFKDPAKGFPMIKKALTKLPHPERVQVVLAGMYSDWACGCLQPLVDVVDLGYIEGRAAICQLYALSDIFLFASLAETFPCVILEAMACGCCVVATPTSGVTEQIIDNKTGILSAKIDGVSLGEALKSIIDYPEKQKTLGEQARSYVRAHFSEKTMIESYIEVYRELVQNNSRKSK